MSSNSDNKLILTLQSIVDDEEALNRLVKEIIRNRVLSTLYKMGFYYDNKGEINEKQN